LTLRGAGSFEIPFRTNVFVSARRGDDILFDILHFTHPGPEDVRDLSLLQFFDILTADHSPVRYNTELARGETGPDASDYRNEGLHISRIARLHLATDGFALIVDGRAHAHLLKIRAVILAVFFLANGLSS